MDHWSLELEHKIVLEKERQFCSNRFILMNGFYAVIYSEMEPFSFYYKWSPALMLAGLISSPMMVTTEKRIKIKIVQNIFF